MRTRPNLLATADRLTVLQWLAGFVLGEAAGMSLAVAGVVIVFTEPLGWRSLAVLVSLTVMAFAVATLAHVPHALRTIHQFVEFLLQYGHCRFTPIYEREYFRALQASVPDEWLEFSQDWRNARQGRLHVLPGLARIQKGWLRIIVAETHPDDPAGPLPACLVTHSCMFGAWIIIGTHPRRLPGLQHHFILHELQHCTVHNSTVNPGRAWEIITTGATLLVLPILVTPSMAAALLPLLAVVLTLTLLRMRGEAPAREHLHDEIRADLGALERSDPAWFGNLPGERVADALGIREPLRRRVFTENLERMRGGERVLTPREVLPREGRLERATSTLHNLGLVTLMVTAGVLHAPLQGGRLAILVTTAGLGLIGYFLALTALFMRAQYADYIVGRPVTETTLWQALPAEVVHHLAYARTRCGRVVPPDASDVLFEPGEAEASLDRPDGRALLIHQKPVDHAALHSLEYDAEDRCCAVVLNDGTRLDLGVRIPVYTERTWRTAGTVTLAQGDGGPGGEVTLPLTRFRRKTRKPRAKSAEPVEFARARTSSVDSAGSS